MRPTSASVITAVLLATSVNARASNSQEEGWNEGRQLAAAAAKASPEPEAWQLGRVSWTNPSLRYQQQILHYSDSTPLSGGSCNLYNGQQSTANHTSEIVPLLMQAGMATSSPDFAGSCGRCYELRCVNGSTMANLTSNGTQIPLALKLAKPPYTQPTHTNKTFVDDYNRTFPGNAESASDLLGVQCWSSSSSAPPIFKITDSCKCSPAGPTCCTNMDHFNVDYTAFEKLAHPGYGLINVNYRPVICPEDLPGLNETDLPLNFTYNTTIVSTHLESGWGINPWAGGVKNAITQELLATVQRRNITSPAVCFTFDLVKANLQPPTGGASAAFDCQGCDASLSPFAVTSTAGLKFDIMWAQNNSGSQYSYLRRHLPPLQIAFADKDGIPVGAPITSLPETSPPFDGGWISTQVLYQNAAVQQAIGNMSVLQGAFQLQFGYDQAADTDQSDVISFCVANLTMLDSTVVLSTGLPSYTPPLTAPSTALPNCPFGEPEPTNQDGQFVALQTLDLKRPSNTSAQGSVYTVFPQSDNANQFGLFNTTCSAQTSNMNQYALTLINQCANSSFNNGYPQCCYSFKSKPPADGADVFATLADLCDAILLHNDTGSYVCNGFNYNTDTMVAYFKAQLVDHYIPSNSSCNSPNVTSWLLQTGVDQEPDTRAIAAEARGLTVTKSGRSWGIGKLWSVAATAGAIASAGVALFLWLVLTNSYRLNRQMIIKEVTQHITEADIIAVTATAEGASAIEGARGSIFNPMLTGTSTLDYMESSTGLMDAAVMSAAIGTMSRGGSVGVGEDVRKVAKQITRRCLHRWDGFMGLRADTDSLGNKSGIWKNKFDCVRCAVMLLAMRRFNEYLADSHAGSLMKTWQQSNWKHQGMIITQLCRVLQSISEEEAQALPLKDPETGGVHDKLCSMCHACCSFRLRSPDWGRANFRATRPTSAPTLDIPN